MQQTVTVVIPAYEPDVGLESLVRDLANEFPVLIVDDGSGGAYAGIFRSAEEMGAVVLRHDVNRGKGAALKTAFRYLLANGAPTHAVTADADGQHSVQDIFSIASALSQFPDMLILGSRDVSRMPPRSRLGNTITRTVFRLFTGLAISDTQTGLRGIPASLLERMTTVPGDRYEYEMNVLLTLKKWGVACKEIPIRTIYLNGNRSSHFHPVRDGLRVFSRLFRYALASLGCTALDYGLYCLLLPILRPAWSYAAARVCSACVNYQVVRRMVFHTDPSARSALFYALLAIFSMAAGAAGTAGLSALSVNSILAKLVLDTLLFAFNYLVQKKLIFRRPAAFDAGRCA